MNWTYSEEFDTLKPVEPDIISTIDISQCSGSNLSNLAYSLVADLRAMEAGVFEAMAAMGIDSKAINSSSTLQQLFQHYNDSEEGQKSLNLSAALETKNHAFRQSDHFNNALQKYQELVKIAVQSLTKFNDCGRPSGGEINIVGERHQLSLTVEQQRAAIEDEAARRVAESELDLVRHREEIESEFGQKLAEWHTEADARRVQFADELNKFESRIAESDSQREALAAGFRELNIQRMTMEGQRGEWARERQTHEAERQRHEERRQESEARFLERESIVIEREEKIAEDWAALDLIQKQLAADLQRFDRGQTDLIERQRELDARSESIESRHEQLLLSVAELKEQSTLASVELAEAKLESERNLRQKNQLDERAAQLAGRATEVETQQATLEILRARLDCQRQELDCKATHLLADHQRVEAAWADVKARLDEAEQARLSLTTAQALTTEQQKQFAEQQALLNANRAGLAAQREELAALECRLQNHQLMNDGSSAYIAEQTAILKAKMAQMVELQKHLQTDRRVVRQRELIQTDADSARGQFQEQLRHRSDELAQQAKQLDETAQQHASDRQAQQAFHAELQQKQFEFEQNWNSSRETLQQREAAMLQRSTAIAEREQILDRRIARLREVGQSVVQGLKELHAARQKWETERASVLEVVLTKLKEIAKLREKASIEAEGLLKRATELEDREKGLFDKLLAARDVLRGQFHELKTTIKQSETRIELKQAEQEAASRKTDAAALDFARRMEQLRLEKDEVSERREQIEQPAAGDGIATARDRNAIAVLKATAPRASISTDTLLGIPTPQSTIAPASVVWNATTPVGELSPARIVPPVAGGVRAILTTQTGQPLPPTFEVKFEIAGTASRWLSIDESSLLEQTAAAYQPIIIRIRGIGPIPILLQLEITKKT